MLGLFASRARLFSVESPGRLFLFGTDKLGRDIYTRTICAARISLSMGLVGVSLSFLIGSVLGGLSGYYGGRVDMFIQRVIEFLISIPTIPLWMALAAALPRDWNVTQIYFSIVVILSLVGWGGLARAVRGKLLELREHDFTMAARIAGAKQMTIIRRHLLPSFASYLIVHLTLAIPDMILAETALSFLGLGLAPAGRELGRAAAACHELSQYRHLPVVVDSRAVRDRYRDGIQLHRRRHARRRRPLQALSAPVCVLK